MGDYEADLQGDAIGVFGKIVLSTFISEVGTLALLAQS
jgi:hypothetical protein